MRIQPRRSRRCNQKKKEKKNEENKRKQEKHVERRGELTFYPLVSSAGNFPMPVAKFLAGLRMFHGQVNRRTESQSSRSSDLAKLKEDKKKNMVDRNENHH